MLLFLLFISLLITLTCYHYITERSLSPLLWLISFIKNLYRNHGKFLIAISGVGILHLWGTIWLGNVNYNASNFDIFTHLLFGYFARELIAKVDAYHPFVVRIKVKLGRLGNMVTLSTLALAFCLTHELQEYVQRVTPVLKALLDPEFTSLNQARDLMMSVIGITLSAKIHKIKANQQA